ncbi:hypothetical protein HMPREF0791_1660 [Staphylococcus epidermidis W23144]|nr:hypothetical protein HMPREF0791_1660 [Staphylococcus epidermidis W23144]
MQVRAFHSVPKCIKCDGIDILIKTQEKRVQVSTLFFYSNCFINEGLAFHINFLLVKFNIRVRNSIVL